MPPVSLDASPAGIRRLMTRKTLAAYRQRTAVARQLGVSESEIAALQHLSEGGITPGELGRRLQLTSGGMTALLHRLYARQHIVRRPHPIDRRSVIVSADPAVLESIGEIFAPLVADADAITARLPPRDRQIAHDYLACIVESSERHADLLVAGADESSDLEDDDDALHLWA